MGVAEILPQATRTKPKGRPAVYVLACRDGSFYCGATTDLERRLALHGQGKAARYTRSRLPVRLVAWWHPGSYDAARSHEARFKALTRREKEEFVKGKDAFGLLLLHDGDDTC